MSKADDQKIEEGYKALRREYNKAINQDAKDILSDAEDSNDSYESADTDITEMVLHYGNRTKWADARALDTITVSQHSEVIDQMGGIQDPMPFKDALKRAAYFAYREDLFDAIQGWESEFWREGREYEIGDVEPGRPAYYNPSEPAPRVTKAKLLR